MPAVVQVRAAKNGTIQKSWVEDPSGRKEDSVQTVGPLSWPSTYPFGWPKNQNTSMKHRTQLQILRVSMGTLDPNFMAGTMATLEFRRTSSWSQTSRAVPGWWQIKRTATPNRQQNMGKRNPMETVANYCRSCFANLLWEGLGRFLIGWFPGRERPNHRQQFIRWWKITSWGAIHTDDPSSKYCRADSRESTGWIWIG